MEEQVARYVATEQKQPLPPPPSEVGIIGRMRKNLFATPLEPCSSIVAGLFVIWGSWNIIDWAWVNAVFTGSDREACLADRRRLVGACWAFVSAKFAQFIYGRYPLGERWRVDIVFALLAILVAGVLIPRIPYKRTNAILLFGVFPFAALILLTGGRFEFSGDCVAFLLLIAAAATIADTAWQSRR